MKYFSFNFYRHFLDGTPDYLARHYWWAYLWSAGVWFFDHQPIINAILFGQYKKLMKSTLEKLITVSHKDTLQLTCVYGKLTPKIQEAIAPELLHIADVAMVQLILALRKSHDKTPLLPVRMNAENLAYANDSFSTIVVFFLLHELPPGARANVYSECMRILKPGGNLLITEYGPLPQTHFLYRIAPFRWLITILEPFLDGFWREDVTGMLTKYAKPRGREVQIIEDDEIFGGFYRVTQYKINKKQDQILADN